MTIDDFWMITFSTDYLLIDYIFGFDTDCCYGLTSSLFQASNLAVPTFQRGPARVPTTRCAMPLDCDLGPLPHEVWSASANPREKKNKKMKETPPSALR